MPRPKYLQQQPYDRSVVSNDAFLGYVETHSETERHAFSRADADRLMDLAGMTDMLAEDCGIPGFVGIGPDTAKALVKIARRRLKAQRH
jgi:hypothetical protein